ncbi:flagellar motor switch protein FliN [Paenisporosarcina sp. HGH0030]|uniref:flagellar motor switch phosphatase FliY n=1 Tax=Paenisporosarcina sp. HGH0030 TaxID=1078085 RepID=UPI00034E4870|nr:flagellar motor switch phosphatase FliY [Paenisporosarcina sp. HGH0030]EPD49619.1 flagellar motor switch protein FliN [Paenisporosarcina sp. HGH0030]
MKTDKLSPDEIKGLLEQSGTDDETISESSLSKREMEALTELLNVSLGSSSAVLTTLFSQQVSFSTPKLSIRQNDQLLTNTKEPFIVVLGEYEGGINGLQILSLHVDDVQTMTNLIYTDSEENHIRKQFQVVEEVVQKMFTSVSQSMTTVLDQEVSHSLSSMDLIETLKDFPVAKFTDEKWFVEADFQLKIGTQENISLQLYIPVRLGKQVVEILTDLLEEGSHPEETKEMQFQSTTQTDVTTKTDESGSSPKIQSVQFSNFDESGSAHSEPNNLDMLLDIPLQVTVELGRTKRMVKEILSVSQGSIIELDKLAGEPVDILINNKLIAVGEVVVIDENFGVRVTDILSTAERISKLR